MSINRNKSARDEEEKVTILATGKGTRIEEKNVDQNANVYTNDFLEEILGNGDTEIFSTLIPMMKDLDVLKTCRLVCKSWNEFACRSLRKLPRVYYPVREHHRPTTDDHLKVLKQNKHLKLPSPFRHFKMTAEYLKTKSFIRCLKYLGKTPENYMMDLRLNPSMNVNLKELLVISKVNNARITTLVLHWRVSLRDSGSNIFQPQDILLPHLKKLSIVGMEFALRNYGVAELCENICRHSPLKSLRITGAATGERLKKFLDTGGLISVEKLYLDLDFVSPLSPETFKHACARIMEIPCIKKLELYCFGTDNFMASYDGYEAIVDHFADSLESLKRNYLPDLKYKMFPKLEEITYSSLEKFVFSYPVEMYPVLKKASFEVGYFSSDLVYSFLEECAGIEELIVGSGLTKDNDLLKFICAMGTGFPNVSSFSLRADFYESMFTLENIITICKSFPKLTALELWGDYLMETNPYLTLSDLKTISGLQKLSLGPQVIVNRHLFIHCLSKMSKLEYLRFYWNGDVSAEDVRDSVGHVRKIEAIRRDNKKEWVEEMERLGVMLPAVVEIIPEEKLFMHLWSL